MQAVEKPNYSKNYSNLTKLNTIVNYSDKKYAEVNVLLEDTSGLYDPQYKPWFAKRFFKLGSSRVYQIAAQVKEAKVDNKHWLFLKLIKVAYGG